MSSDFGHILNRTNNNRKKILTNQQHIFTDARDVLCGNKNETNGRGEGNIDKEFDIMYT